MAAIDYNMYVRRLAINLPLTIKIYGIEWEYEESR